MEVNKGTNHFYFDDGTLDEMPQEVQEMVALAKNIVKNTVTMVKATDINPSVLPSAYLEAFNRFMPTILKMIEEDGDGTKEDFINGQINTLKLMIERLEKQKA